MACGIYSTIILKYVESKVYSTDTFAFGCSNLHRSLHFVSSLCSLRVKWVQKKPVLSELFHWWSMRETLASPRLGSEKRLEKVSQRCFKGWPKIITNCNSTINQLDHVRSSWISWCNYESDIVNHVEPMCLPWAKRGQLASHLGPKLPEPSVSASLKSRLISSPSADAAW